MPDTLTESAGTPGPHSNAFRGWIRRDRPILAQAAQRQMYGVFYASREAGELALAMFRDHDDAVAWLADQCSRHGCDLHDLLIEEVYVAIAP